MPRRSSAARKRKKPRRGQRPWRRWWLPAGALLLLGLGLAWGLYSPGTRPPAYEEPPPATRALPELEQALFAALEHLAAPGSFTLSHYNGHRGEITLVKAHLAAGHSLREAENIIRRRLERGGARVRRLPAQTGLHLEASLNGRPALRLRLLPPRPRLAPPAPPTPSPRPQVALLVDDLGYDLQQMRALAALGIPLTVSVLPFSPHGAEVARLAHAKGLQVMLHLPMEPLAYPQMNPGPGALLSNMSPQELERRTLAALASVPHVVGVNNHMGSRFTQDASLLLPVLTILQKRGLFFVDSKTSAASQGLDTARRLGLPSARRGIFLDNQATPAAVEEQIRQTISLARQRGAIIAIGHPHAATLKALQKWAPALRKSVRLVLVSELVQPPATARAGARAGR